MDDKCPDCDSKRIDGEIMRLVTGQVDGPVQMLHVATCIDCGCVVGTEVIVEGQA